MKDTILLDIKNLFEDKEEENYYKPIRVSNSWSNNYIENESNGNRNKTLSVEKHLDKIRPYLKDIINNLKKSDTWKIQLTIANNFISSTDNDKDRAMHSKIDDLETMMNDEADEVIKELFDLLKNRYQNNLESMKGSKFVFNYVHLLYYKCYKINPNRRGSYVDSPDWIKSKIATINPISKKDNKCFQYAVTTALNQEEIGKCAKRITKIKPFINKYASKGIIFPTEKDVLYAQKEKLYPD